MKNIMMVANSETTFNGFSFLASELVDERDDRCTIICENEDINVDRFVKRNHVDLSKVNVFVFSDYSKFRYPQPSNVIKKMARYIKKTFDLLYVYLKKTHDVKKIFDEISYDEVLVRTDNRVGYEPYIIREANKRKIPVIVIPMSTVSSDTLLINENNGYKVYKSKGKSLLEKIAYKINPNWVIDDGDKWIYFFDPFRLIATNFLHLMSPMPWIVGCGYSNKVCTATEKNYLEACKYLGEEVAKKKYIWTGTVEEQIVIRSIENKKTIHDNIVKKYGLKNNFVCIYSDSPLYEVSIGDVKHKEMFTRIVFEELIQRFGEFILSPHPISDLDFLRKICAEYNVKIMTEPLREVTGAADVNVYPDLSGENEWGIKFGIQRITYPRKLSFEKLTEDSMKKIRKSLQSEVSNYKKEIAIDIIRKRILDVV